MSKLRSTKFLVPSLLLGLLAATPALAEETHRYEVSASWHNHDSDSIEINTYGLTGEFYFAPVDAKDKPLAEAYFLDRVGSVGLSASKSDYDFDPSYGADATSLGLFVTYTRPDLPFLFLAGYGNSNLDYDPPFSSWKSSSDTYTVGAGYYLLDSLLVSIVYQQVEQEIDAGSTQYDLTGKIYGLAAKYLKLLSNTTAYNLEGGYSLMEGESISGPTEDDWSVNLIGDYYFTNLISLGAGVAVVRGDSESSEGEEYLIRNKTFFTHNIGVELEYSQFQAKNTSGEDEDFIQVSLIGHF